MAKKKTVAVSKSKSKPISKTNVDSSTTNSYNKLLIIPIDIIFYPTKVSLNEFWSIQYIFSCALFKLFQLFRFCIIQHPFQCPLGHPRNSIISLLYTHYFQRILTFNAGKVLSVGGAWKIIILRYWSHLGMSEYEVGCTSRWSDGRSSKGPALASGPRYLPKGPLGKASLPPGGNNRPIHRSSHSNTCP